MQRTAVAVIGAGAAGLLAAGRAAMCGAQVLLLEKMEKPTRKLRITGKGRCNITNSKTLNDFAAEIHHADFVRPALGAFFNQQIVELLQAQGVPTVVERGGRVFPASGRAADVANALERWARQQGAQIANGWEVQQLQKLPNGLFSVSGAAGQRLEAQAVVVATGGLSYPLTGSTGDGLRMAKHLGHNIIPPLPTLVGLRVQRPFDRASGLTLKNALATLCADGQAVAQQMGEVMFTRHGIEGAAILRLSRQAVQLLHKRQRVEVLIDLKPALSPEKMFNRMVRELEQQPTLDAQGLLRKLMPAPMLPHVLGLCRLPSHRPAQSLTDEELSEITDTLKALTFSIIDHGPWAEAIATAGGVSTTDIDPHTMQSRRVPGLHFAGEVIDIDANTGGYNLQMAFSTGWLAGQNAARYAMGL